MSKNILFCFSGTGNCLHVAKGIAWALEDSHIIGMNRKGYEFDENIESIGFIYPTYFQGIPLQVERFVTSLKIPNQVYLYAVATYGGMVGNGVSDLNAVLKESAGRELEYGRALLMFENYIVWYDMNKLLEKGKEITRKSDHEIEAIINDIRNRKVLRNTKTSKILRLFYKVFSSKIPKSDRYLNVSTDCISCERCERICPVENILMQSGKPTFQGKCEQCMACIQTCPKEAINYKNKTQTRGRYYHPNIKVDELIALNRK